LRESSIANVAGGHKAVTPTVVFRIAKFAKLGLDDIHLGYSGGGSGSEGVN
jgi:hypothetical protein